LTHIFECPTNEYNQIHSEVKKLDILNFGRSVSVGDKIIYQRLNDTEDGETKEGELNETPFTEDECSVIIEYIFIDDEKLLKKGFTAIQFYVEESKIHSSK